MNALFRYGIALAGVAIAVAISYPLRGQIYTTPLFFITVVLTCWYGGTEPAIVATTASAAAIHFFIHQPQPPLTTQVNDLPRLAEFIFVSAVAIYLVGARKRAEQSLRQARDELEIKVEERTAKLSKLNDELLNEIAERALTDDRLRQTEERLRDIIANAPVVLFALDRSGVVTLSEGKGLDTFGVKAGELVGQSIFDLYHDSPGLHSSARRALAGEAVTFVTDWNNQSFEIHLIPLFDKAGTVAGVTGVTYNITDRRKAERELRLVIDTIPAMSWSCLPNGDNDYCSTSWMEYTGMKPGTEFVYGWADAFHPEDRPAHLARWRAATETGELFESIARIRGRDGEYRWFLTQGVPLRDESGKIVRWYGTNVDIDEQKRAQSLLEGEKRLLEMTATGVPLKEILNNLCLIIEEQRPGTLASALMLNRDGIHLDCVAGPSLPSDWKQQMEKLPIGPCAGSCGTAAYRGSRVIVSDIANDPLWELPEHRESALQHGLRASWSNPVLSSKRQVLGTFCVYHREPRTPTSQDIELIELATHLVRVAIERDRAQEAIRQSEQLARSHVDVMMRSLDVLATEAAPEKFIGEMLRTIGQNLGAVRVLLWLRDRNDDSLRLHLTMEGDQQIPPDPKHPLMRDPRSWRKIAFLQEMLFAKSPMVCDDIENESRIGPEFRDYLASWGTKRFMSVPMFVTGELRGFIGIQHAEAGLYRADQIELAQALAHHVMLAVRNQELVEQQREAAILKERTRMARDIHDTLAQGFTGVVVQMEAAEEALFEEDPDNAVQHVRRARDLARDSLAEARRSVHALRPQALERAGFADALKAIIKNTAAGTSLRTDFRIKGTPRELGPAIEENLLHIGQEALTNALRHARASEFKARLWFDSDQVRLELQDNGDGFSVDKVNGGGFGLIGMKERAEHIGAELQVSSAPGSGTKIVAVTRYQSEN